MEGDLVSLARPRHPTEELLGLYGEVAAAARRKPGCVVLVDETTSPALIQTVFGRFRDETWQLPLRWVVVGDTEARATYLAPPADAFFEVVVELAPLSDEASVELLRRRLEDVGDPDLADLAALAELADGNPRRLLTLAREVLVDGTPTAALGAARDSQAAQLAELGPAAHRLVEELAANGPASASDESLLRRLSWSRGRAAQVFGQLERAGLVRKSTRRADGTSTRKVYELTTGLP